MFRSSLILLTVLCLLVGADYLSAWTAPATLPPTSNVAAPINTSGASQIKQGGLGVGALDVAGGALVRGTTATNDLDLTVLGRVGAAEYCDVHGNNCRSGSSAPLISCRQVSAGRASGFGNPATVANCASDEFVTGGGCRDTCGGDCTSSKVESSMPVANGWSCDTSNTPTASAICCKVNN